MAVDQPGRHQRAAQVDFSDIYYENSAVFVAKKGAFKGPEELVDKTVGVQNGTSHQSYLVDNWVSKGLLTVPYADPRELVMDVLRHVPDVEVISPTELRDEVLRRLRAGLERIGVDE